MISLEVAGWNITIEMMDRIVTKDRQKWGYSGKQCFKWVEGKPENLTCTVWKIKYKEYKCKVIFS